MTLQRPMFPPRADQKNCSRSVHLSGAATAPVSTSAESEQVETRSDAEQVNGAAAKPFLGAVDEEEPNLYLPTDLTPEELFQALGRLRSEAEEAVERLIALIDALDGDIDAEPTGDEEPDLGSVSSQRGSDQRHWAQGVDGEPLHASNEYHPAPALDWWSDRQLRIPEGSQEGWATGNDDDREGAPCDDDREQDHDGREPDVEDEPSLGWTSVEAGLGRYGGAFGQNDLEIDTDTGIGDRDGLMEQCPALFDRTNVGVIA